MWSQADIIDRKIINKQEGKGEEGIVEEVERIGGLERAQGWARGANFVSQMFLHSLTYV